MGNKFSMFLAKKVHPPPSWVQPFAVYDHLPMMIGGGLVSMNIEEHTVLRNSYIVNNNNWVNSLYYFVVL